MGTQVSFELVDRIVLARLGGCLPEPVDDDGADDLAEELFLVREVEIDRAFRDPGATGDIVEPRAGEAALAEDIERGLEDLAGALFGKPSPAWSGPPRGALGRGGGPVAVRFVRLGIAAYG